jgi:DNA-binding protein Fis
MPPGRHSKLVTMSSADSFLHTYAVKDPSRDWWHMAIGTYHDVGDGGDCFHYKTNAYQLVLHHLNDSLEQFLVADTTAGIDNLSTSLSIGYDLCVLCVEPTKKSVSVLENFLALSSSLPVPCLVIANKIEDPADSKFVRRYVPASMSCVTFPFVQEILEQERGSNRNISIGLEGFEAGFEAIIDAARVSQQDSRAARTALLRELFKQRVESYWNSFHGADLGVLLEDSAVAN